MILQICSIVSFVVSIAAFLYGIFGLKKGGPMCFLLFVFAVGCHSMKELWSSVNVLLYGMGQPNLSILGTFGCFCFLYSSNYGQLDSVVDEGGQSSKKSRLQALAAPVVVAAIVGAFGIRNVMAMEFGKTIWTGVSYVPAALAGYYSLKHLFLKEDAVGFLKMTRLCNYASLFYIFLCCCSLLVQENEVLLSLFSVLSALSSAALVYACKKGLKIWETLI